MFIFFDRFSGFTARFLPCLWLLLAATPLHALEIVPFTTSNQSPLVQIHGLPAIGEAHTLTTGERALSLPFDVANGYSRGARVREGVELDWESYRLVAGLTFGLVNGWEWGVALPYTAYRGGGLDSAIRQWHDLLGLPQGNRRSVPDDRLLISYERDDVALIHLDEPTQGIGDLRLLAAKELYRRPAGEEAGSVTLRASLKLPTGNSDRLLGSGSTDLALWLTGDRHLRSNLGVFALYGGGGPLLMTDGAILPEQQNNLVVFGTLGGGWSPTGGLNFKIQIDGHSPFYRGSDFEELGSSLQLVLGGSLPLSPRTRIDIALSEDLLVRTSPDAVFHLALRSRF